MYYGIDALCVFTVPAIVVEGVEVVERSVVQVRVGVGQEVLHHLEGRRGILARLPPLFGAGAYQYKLINYTKNTGNTRKCFLHQKSVDGRCGKCQGTPQSLKFQIFFSTLPRKKNS